MGQSITVEPTLVGDVVIYDADRSLTGQDGAGFGSAEEAATTEGFAAELARRIFERDAQVANVFVASNQIVVKRNGGWSEGDVGAVGDVITTFFLFYTGS